MTVQFIKKQASKLPVNSRAKLASYLLKSLDDLNESEIDVLWAEESLRRHEDIVSGKAKSRLAEIVFRNARARIK